MSWLTDGSPLRHRQTLPPSPSTTAMKAKHRSFSNLEKGFVVDAVITAVNASHPGRSVIPPYDATTDKYASAYFRSPSIQAMRERNVKLNELKTERNKLSTRRRCKPTPTPDDLRVRRNNFVVDAVEEERKRSRFHDIIPPYAAKRDQHCRAYFQRPDIKKLLSVTLSPR
ncbi:hypothetical protein ACOMHN_004160 [Nucella lapillus]